MIQIVVLLLSKISEPVIFRVLLKSKLSEPSNPLVYFLVVLVLKSKPQFFQKFS